MTPFVSQILSVAGIESRGSLSLLLGSHHVRTGQSLFDVPGLDFCGTPGMTVTRIKREYVLARELRSYFDDNPAAGAPLETVERVRAFVKANAELAPLLDAEPFPRLAAEEPSGFDFGFILSLVFQGLLKFFWPALCLLGLFVVGATMMAGLSEGFTVGVITFILSVIIAGIAMVAAVVTVYLGLRRLEAANTPVDTLVSPDVMAALTEAENLKDTQQNHLAGISIMQAGLLRGMTLRIAFWVIGQMATKRFRPGFLGDISTIHYARWLRLPKTDKLLFFSNYGGSWESYLEDFITKAAGGLTAAWSNTVGFPRTENLFFKGATDGDRFKRWARRQQQPTWFWYSAYPHLTTARIRTNASIRQGLGTVSTEDEAAAWLGLFGSKVRPAALIETFEVQTLLYGGLSKHPYAACLAIRLSDDPKQACAWLKSIEDQITFGDQPPADKVLICALTADGLRRLGLPSDVQDAFPAAFRLGMGSPGRANLLADTGDDQARQWLWGGPENSVDAALLLYADSEPNLASYAMELISGIDAAGGRVTHRVTPTPLPRPRPGETAAQAVREPFGFADGISQPIIKGTRRWMRRSDAIHAVEPGSSYSAIPTRVASSRRRHRCQLRWTPAIFCRWLSLRTHVAHSSLILAATAPPPRATSDGTARSWSSVSLRNMSMSSTTMWARRPNATPIIQQCPITSIQSFCRSGSAPRWLAVGRTALRWCATHMVQRPESRAGDIFGPITIFCLAQRIRSASAVPSGRTFAGQILAIVWPRPQRMNFQSSIVIASCV
ncbi:hypothetical protein U8P71_34510 (plasmid) [Rhizobium ruizarguesonis]|nr:hypothetical protein U8P71_34510 [Rhizobium ruizarguesonis]